MSDSITVKAPVVDGKAVTGTSETYQSASKKGSSALGKDAFLQLLVAQMQNQDPLKPADNTQMVSELAQFTTIEEIQNLANTMKSNSAFDLVGKNVIIEVGKSTDSTTTKTIGGYVEYVKMVDGKAMLSIGDELYDYNDLLMVIDEDYLDYVLNEGKDKDPEIDPEKDPEKDPDKDPEKEPGDIDET